MAGQVKSKSKAELISEIESIMGETVPIEIKNHEAFLQYLNLKGNKLHSKIINIGGKDIPLKSGYPLIKKALEAAGLKPEDSEYKSIINMKNVQMGLLMKANAQLRKAYGTIVNSKGEKVELKSVFDPVKEEMIQLFGRMFTSKEVHEFCLTKWKIICSFSSVQDFRQANSIQINKLIEEHQRTFSDIRLGHKRSRLEELVWLYRDRKAIYEVTKKSDDYRLLLNTLSQIKSEAEGDVIRIDGTVDININQTVEHHIQKNLRKTISIKEVILARVAAKTNINPVKLIAGIHASYYRQVIDNTEDIEHEVMPDYPSTQNYDFDRIRAIQVQKEQVREIEKQEEKKVDKVAVAAGNRIKELLQAKLKEKEGDINQAKNQMSGAFLDKANR